MLSPSQKRKKSVSQFEWLLRNTKHLFNKTNCLETGNCWLIYKAYIWSWCHLIMHGLSKLFVPDSTCICYVTVVYEDMVIYFMFHVCWMTNVCAFIYKALFYNNKIQSKMFKSLPYCCVSCKYEKEQATMFAKV